MTEVLAYHNYYKPQRKPSEIIPGLMVTDYENGVLTCPRCGLKQDNIPHGKARTCECGLVMEVRDNVLRISQGGKTMSEKARLIKLELDVGALADRLDALAERVACAERVRPGRETYGDYEVEQPSDVDVTERHD